MIFSISFKNIWRNKIRSLVVIMAITIGLTGGILTVALMQGMVDQRLNIAIDSEVSHIQIHNSKYLLNPELMENIGNADSIINAIKQIPEVKFVVKRTRIPVMINTARTSTGVNIVGINPDEERSISTFYKNVADSAGSFFKETKPNQIVIGRKLAEKLKAKLKSKVVVTFQDTSGNLIGAAFKISGIFKSSNSIIDETTAFISNDDFTRLTGLSSKSAHEIAIRVENLEQIPLVQERLKSMFPSLTVRNWKQIQPELSIMVEWMGFMNYIIIGIILLALGFGILNTMLMAVLERIKELGMLMAIGMSKRKIFSMIMLESIFLSVIGGIVGTILSLVFVHLLNHHGVDFGAYSQAFERLGYPSVIFPSIPNEFFIGLTIMVLFTGILSAVYPARKALKLNPVEALHSDT
ncbi:MAG TPA: ABC transporter permease [Bacteroidales bacterium]|nr:ABC transporter permease [Bacteroidales bacterium]